MEEIRRENANTDEESERYVDWRGRPSNPNKHGGMTAASFLLGFQGFEIMGVAAVGNNLITYLVNDMRFSLPKSANIVTNFVGTIFLMALLGGYLSDSFLGSIRTILIFSFLELFGFILLSMQAHFPELKPSKCSNILNGECQEAKGLEAAIFFLAIYMVALGSGCVKPNMIAHGGDQFNRRNSQQLKSLSTYFNLAYFAFSMGELVALTLLIWVQTHSGMDTGFAVSATAMALGLLSLICGTLSYRNKTPQGSILTPVAQVFVAAILKRNVHSDQNNSVGQSTDSPREGQSHTDKFRFLNKACIRVQGETIPEETPWRLCSITQVEQVKTLLSTIPIFACTIIFNTILAQLQTFSVQQGSSMDTHLSRTFQIPPASLQSIPYMLLIVLVPLYDAFFVPFARKLTGHDSGISPLTRIGFGLFAATFSMISAAFMEKKRRDQAVNFNQKLPILWITPQFVIFGLSEMFTAVGLIEFFYKQSNNIRGMEAFLTSITYCSYSFGFYLSSVLVSLVNKITRTSSNGGWLHENDLNKDRVDLFYWLLAALSFLNFLNYLFWSRWYSSK
ncbi:protein NRT1/ PTR FAMILY 4.3-like [Neltuma alba]|uniref:protein NRT1/ PTR FAMILY 4.3-like n=1 Tax=Neltuma alba TaxID=207710 RepID=UPI0010A38443|nr:protein NRT1/ PTR FAMILY 4.3-like [Prosopis alba]